MEYRVLNTKNDKFTTPPVISLDTEYSELNIKKAKLLSISIGVSPDLTYILKEFGLVRDFLKNAEVIFTWNGTVDAYMLDSAGYSFPRERMLDGMLMEHLIDERVSHSLGDYALRSFNDSYKEEFWEKYKSYQEAPEDEANEYEMRDGCYTFIAGTQYLKQLSNQLELVRHVHRLQWALFDTEIKGIKVNKDLIIQTKQTMSKQINEYLPRLREEYHDAITVWELDKWKTELGKRSTDNGRSRVQRPEFSFASGQQVSWLLYDCLEYTSEEKTKKGNPSTSYETLKGISIDHPELKTLVDYKEAKAVYSTFVEGMLDRVEEDNRIYPGFFVNGTTTGRISHNNPNMGNLPTDGVIRNFFIPDEGNCIIGADYSQLEVVIEANLTQDKQLLRIINEGASKHDITAEGLGIDRNSAKTLNFALQYGAGAKKVSKILGLSFKDSEDIFRRYWELYSGVKALKDITTKEVQDKGQVTNLFGRTRHFDEPENHFEAGKQERQAYNFLIQGVGADMMNMAAYLIQEDALKSGWGRLWFSVHDEAVAECKNDLVEQAIDAIVKSMDIPNDYLKLVYRVQVKTYGPFDCWRKA